MYFPSKKDLWLTLIIWGAILAMVVPATIEQQVVGLLVALPIAFFIGWLWFSTGYTIENSILKIKYGPFRKEVNIQDISKINKTKNPISAPELSIDRIAIIHGKFFDGVFISPKNEREFVQLLVQENPNIVLDKKLKDRLGK
ncbi:PH domain-containing protein [Halalkalibacter alkalisediminis]|uniref:PH domain-containing protein n=1 Tax=Halalkalibacter alkalisediminis TaxID=935616 RepID=A0ABV6NP27_9BACI|nr:PH domain-containing protein [Halalkalibacter alkalisediminis]